MLNQLVVLVLLSTIVWGLNPKLRIIGGRDVAEGTVPYIVSIRTGENHRHICGGSILDKTHVLTAAHCLYGLSPDELSVQYGVTSITEGQNTSNVVNVSKIVYHDQFVGIDGMINDIGIIKLASPIYYDKHIRPVKLPTAFSPTPALKKAHLAGWGLSYTWGTVTRHLQEVELTVSTDSTCESTYKDFTISSNRRYHICAGVSEGGKGPCNGDSGGPLTIDGIQIGIVSWAPHCALKGYPTVFTKVSSHVNWINTQITADD